MSAYVPLIPVRSPNPNVDNLQGWATELGVTHVQHIDGRVEKINKELNRRSVPLNTTRSQQRWTWDKVSSLGVLTDTGDETGTEPVDGAVAGLQEKIDQAANWEAKYQ